MKGYAQNPVLTHPAVMGAALDAQRSPAQIVLRWALQHGQVSTHIALSLHRKDCSQITKILVSGVVLLLLSALASAVLSSMSDTYCIFQGALTQTRKQTDLLAIVSNCMIHKMHKQWSLQAVIPRSAQSDRIQANMALDFVLSAAAMQRIDEMAETHSI